MSEAVKPMSKPKQLVQWGLVVVLAAIVAIAALPSYFSGQWPWSSPLQVPQIDQLRTLMKTPLVLPDWEMMVHQEVGISGNPWSLAEYRPATGAATQTADQPNNGFALLLRPQNSADKQPEVEWVDIAGSQSWQVDDLHPLKFSVTRADGTSMTVTTRYFRGLDGQNTFAVMQWYAWPTGGHYAPGKWFWADQGRQWSQRERMPWVAVSVLLPIEPVGDIRPHAATMTAIGQAVQASLLESAFGPAD